MVNVAQVYKVVRSNQRTRENKGAKEVEPDGHGEATCGHELYLNELVFMNSMMVVH